MSEHRKNPEDRRERLRQEELKHPSSSVQGSNLADLVGGLGWKSAGIIILVLLLILILLFVFFK